jgi:uncharacterized protein YbaR (Trm112 family)
MSAPDHTTRAFDDVLLSALVCPSTRSPLRYDPVAEELIADAAGLAYPVRHGIPVLLAGAARVLSPE